MPDDLNRTLDNADEGAVAERIARTLQQSGEQANQEASARQNEVVGYDTDQGEVTGQTADDQTGRSPGDELAARSDEMDGVAPQTNVDGTEFDNDSQLSNRDTETVARSDQARSQSRTAPGASDEAPQGQDGPPDIAVDRSAGADQRGSGATGASPTGNQPAGNPAVGGELPDNRADAPAPVDGDAPRPAAGEPGVTPQTPGASTPSVAGNADPSPDATTRSGGGDDGRDPEDGGLPAADDGGDNPTNVAAAPTPDASDGDDAPQPRETQTPPLPDATAGDDDGDAPEPQANAPDADSAAPTDNMVANNAPTAIALDGTAVNENDDGAVIGTLSTTDPDDAGGFTYTVSDDRFEIVDDVLRLRDGESLDAETAASVDITVTSTDSGGASTQQTFTISVADLNEGPTAIALDNATIDENVDGGIVGTLSTTDPDAGDSFAYTVDDPRFEVVDGQLALRDGQSLDAETESTIDITVTSTDSGGTSTQQTFTISVADLNEGPTSIDLDNASISENAAGGIVGTLSTTDPDAGDSFTYDVDDNRFEVVDGKLKLKDGQNLDAETEAAVAVTVTSTDSGGASTQQVFTIAVADEIVDIPVLAANDVVGEAGTPIALDIATSLQDAGADQYLAVTIAGVPDGAMLSAGTDNGDGTWTLTPDQLAGLTLTPPDGSQSDFSLSVTAEAYEAFDNSGTISTANFADTSSGFTVTGRTINPDGTLSEASVDNLTTAGDGIGVAGATGGSANQLGYDASKGVSEQLIVDFDNDVSGAEVECRRLFQNEGGTGHHEVGTWTAYHDGVEVGSGAIAPPSGHAVTFTIDLGEDAVFDQLVFTANEYSNGQNTTSDASDYFVKSIAFTGEVRTGETAETTISFDVAVDATLQTGTAVNDTLNGDAGADELVGLGGNDNIYGGGGDDLMYGGDGADLVYGGDGNDTIVFGEGDGTDAAFAGDGGGWTDVLALQNADGSAVGSGWTLNLTEGSVVEAGDNQVTLSDDAAGSVTLEDGSQVDFEGIEQITW
ncbi:MAG: hypothetical protein RIM84_19130 [Alphaproteobacteria bacterium]